MVFFSQHRVIFTSKTITCGPGGITGTGMAWRLNISGVHLIPELPKKLFSDLLHFRVSQGSPVHEWTTEP